MTDPIKYVAGADLIKDGGFLVVTKMAANGVFTVEQVVDIWPVAREEGYDVAVRAVEYRAQSAAHQVALGDLWSGLESMTDPVARAVLDLHGPQFSEYDRHPATAVCYGCDSDGFDAESPEWPCRTVRVIAEAYGLDVP